MRLRSMISLIIGAAFLAGCANPGYEPELPDPDANPKAMASAMTNMDYIYSEPVARR